VTYLFSRSNQNVLERFARSKALLALDFDGTLAPIVRRPAHAAMRPATRRVLARAVQAYPCVVISGRARADVQRRVRGIAVRRVVGNHGAEPWPGGARLRRLVRAWAPVLTLRLSARRGVIIEDKGYSLAVHYRQARERGAARRAILDAARSLDGVRIFGGKLVVNLVPEGAPHKGVAVERERARLRCDTAIYVGDDDTDEDVFRRRHDRLLSVRIGRKRASAASYYLRNQEEIDRMLRALVDLRKATRAHDTRGGSRART